MPSKSNKKSASKSNIQRAKSNDSAKQNKPKKSAKQKPQKKELNKSINMKQKPNKKGTKKPVKKKKPKKVPSSTKVNKPKRSKKPVPPPNKKLPKSQPKPNRQKKKKTTQSANKQNINKKKTEPPSANIKKKQKAKSSRPLSPKKKKAQKAPKSAPPPKKIPPLPRKNTGGTQRRKNKTNMDKASKPALKSKQKANPKSQSKSKLLDKSKKPQKHKQNKASKPKLSSTASKKPKDTKKAVAPRAKKKMTKPLPKLVKKKDTTPKKAGKKEISTKAKQNTPKKKAKPSPQKRKQDRRTIQRQKDMETAKKRLSKRLSIKLTGKTDIIHIGPATDGSPEKEKSKARRKKTKPAVKQTTQTVRNDKDLWENYMRRFGGEPQNASQLQSFSKTDGRYTTLTYKEAKTIFDKYGSKLVEKKSATKQDRDKIYIQRDIDTAKKRLSARLSAKQMGNIMEMISQKTPTMDVIHDVEDTEEEGSDSDSDSDSDSEDTEDESEDEDTDESEDESESMHPMEDEEDESEDLVSPNPTGGEIQVSYIPPLPKRSTVSVLTGIAKTNSYDATTRDRAQTPPLPPRPPALPQRTRTLDETQRARVRIAKRKGALPPLPRRRTLGKAMKSSPLPRRKTVGSALNTRHTHRTPHTCESIIEIEKFVESERKYVKSGLRICCEVFLNRLQIHNELNESVLSEEDIQTVFSNYAMIYNVNNKLFGDLMEIRLNVGGAYALRDGLGQIMVHFIPYFKMYTDYIVKKHTALSHLEALKQSNKKFKQFLKINETCAKRKLKSFLEEPVHRLPQYLQFLGTIYASYMKEDNSHTAAKGQELLLQSIVDIKRVSDGIANSCRDLKSRMLLGALQKDLFQNKIHIVSAHRLCIAHGEIRMVLDHAKEKKIKTFNLILCNDILLISSLSSKFKSSNLLCVLPLSGLRVSRQPVISRDHAYLLEPENQHKFSLLPSNHVIICEEQFKMEKWIEMIQEAVEEQDHSLKQCNVVDLEKRIRKQKTSKQGASETIHITDPQRIKQIEAWRDAKYRKHNDDDDDDTDAKQEEEPQSRTVIIKKRRSQSEYKLPPALPPRRVTFNEAPHVPTRNVEDITKSPAAPQGKARRSAYPPPPPRRKTVNSEKARDLEPSSSKKANTAEREKKKESKVRKKEITQPVPRRKTVGTTVAGAGAASSSSASNDTMRVPRRKKTARMNSNLLSCITTFKSGNLKHVDEKTLKEKAASEPSNVTNLLQSTLANYRQFVMDDEDDDSDSDGEWSD